jgi:hypothetical protein
LSRHINRVETITAELHARRTRSFVAGLYLALTDRTVGHLSLLARPVSASVAVDPELEVVKPE